jgi:hypothetical protein
MIRLATMMVVIGLAGFAVLKGSQIAALSWSGWGALQPSESGWVDRSSVVVLPSAAGAADTGAQTVVSEQIANAIGRSPLSGRNWLALAGMQVMSGAPGQHIVSSLVMSAVTGPNNLELMAGRGLLGVAIWEVLPPERRLGIAVDLVNATRWRVMGLERTQLAVIIGTKPAHIRQEIRKFLLAVEGASDPIIKDLGFREGNQEAHVR